MVKTGELIQLWDVACQTNLQFNLVRRVWRDYSCWELRDCLRRCALCLTKASSCTAWLRPAFVHGQWRGCSED